MSEFSFVAELDLNRLLIELTERGCDEARLDLLPAKRRNPRLLRVSFAVRTRFELGAHGDGYRMLADAVRLSVSHRALETRLLERARARGR